MAAIRKSTSHWARRVVSRIGLRYRLATASRRTLPDFIIIGAQRAGTSSAYYYLRQHPKIVPSYRKEIHFFDGGLDPSTDTFENGTDWYLAHFPMEGAVGDGGKSFEASPLYMFNPLAPARIAKCLTDVKLIAVLRNPVERAISHYFYERRSGREPLPILEAMRCEEERIRPAIETEDYKHPAFIHYSYQSRGRYAEQLKRYLSLFSRENILVISSNLLFGRPDEALRRVFRFVGVEPDVAISDLKPRNIGSNKTQVEPSVYEYLKEYFRPHNEALYGLLGEDYGW